MCRIMFVVKHDLLVEETGNSGQMLHITINVGRKHVEKQKLLSFVILAELLVYLTSGLQFGWRWCYTAGWKPSATQNN